MQHIVLFFTLWPILSVIVAALFTKNDTSIDVFFLRSLELSAITLWTCYILQVTKVIDGAQVAITGAVVWSFAAIIGEIALKMETDKPASRS